MTSYMSLTYIFGEKVAPGRFPFIVHPCLAAQRIRTMPPSSLSAMLSRQDKPQPQSGANPCQAGRNIHTVATVRLSLRSAVRSSADRKYHALTVAGLPRRQGKLPPSCSPFPRCARDIQSSPAARTAKLFCDY